jgi:putative DNA primase/helicase
MNKQYLTPVMKGIPADLTDRSQRWCNWVTHVKPSGESDERWGKFPISPHSRKLIGVNRPEEWTNFEDAKACYDRYSSEVAGLGILFAAEDGLAAIDIDDGVDDDVLNEWALSIVQRLETYWELSPSGPGLKAGSKRRCPTRSGIAMKSEMEL